MLNVVERVPVSEGKCADEQQGDQCLGERMSGHFRGDTRVKNRTTGSSE